MKLCKSLYGKILVSEDQKIKMYNIIAISGKANTGKDHVSRLIQNSYKYYPFSFALHFKMELVGLGDVTYEEVMDTKPTHVRDIIQQRGTEHGRLLYGEDIWVDTMHSWLTYFSKNWNIGNFIVSDIRFPNEAEYVKRMGGKVFRIKSKDRLAITKLNSNQLTHSSETALDSYEDSYFDGIIENNIDTNNMQLIEQIEVLMKPTRGTKNA